LFKRCYLLLTGSQFDKHLIKVRAASITVIYMPL
jgi:hypothetical protein